MKRNFNARGFTLIELMIVVGIIGVLSALAVPNFLKYQAKAKQSEARLSLASIYTAEKGFFAEYSWYSSFMDSVGWFPEGKTYYRAGFNATFPGTTAITGISLTGNPNKIGSPATGFECSTASILATTATLTIDTFTAQACGKIRGGGGAATTGNDQWTINELKVLTNTSSGV